MEYEYRTSCKDCEDILDCNLEKREKSYNGKCYIHSIAKRIKKKPIDVFRARKHFFDVLWVVPEDWCDGIKEEMACMSEQEKKDLVKNISFHGRHFQDESNDFFEIIVGIYNTILGMWRTDDIIHCMRCGELIKNNKKHNRKYCDSCKGYQKMEYIQRKCAVCGCIFDVESENKRQFRCDTCQEEANRENARNRKRRQRKKQKVTIFA